MSDEFNQLIQNHSRDFQRQQYVYPVVSRRSHGVSIGVNLSPTGFCNFKCVYCQVEGDLRILSGTGSGIASGAGSNSGSGIASASGSACGQTAEVSRNETIRQCRLQTDDQPPCAGANPLTIDLAILEKELRRTLSAALNGELFQNLPFSNTPPGKRRVNDIAFSGDGEPTLSPQFLEAVQIAVKVRDESKQLDSQAGHVKLVLITNATTLHQPKIRDAVDLLADNNGEIWAKLDAGTADYYKKVDRSNVPFETVISNLAETSRRHPLVIQTLFLRLHDELPSQSEINVYIDHLRQMIDSGGTIKLVQLYTIARPTAEIWATPLSNAELDTIAAQIKNNVMLNVESYYGGY